MSKIISLWRKDGTHKNILIFNEKEYILCDSCGNLTPEAPCAKCGGSPIKDLDDLLDASFKYEEEKEKYNHPYFMDGGASLRNIW